MAIKKIKVIKETTIAAKSRQNWRGKTQKVLNGRQ